MSSERIFEKMYNGSRAHPALARGVPQPDESRRQGVIMEALAGIDIAVWDVKAQVLGVPLYQALGAARSLVRGYASGGWAPGDEAEAEVGGYAATAQPDGPRAGGMTEFRRIAALTTAHGVRQAPHAWGSDVLFGRACT